MRCLKNIKDNLDDSEGYKENRLQSKNTYEPIDITERLTECSIDDVENVFTYKHVDKQKNKELNCKYKNIVISGARYHEIPESYINNFLDVPCVSDDQPIGHHYLPQNTHLRFFESPNKEGFVWMYQRGKDPKQINKKNVAKENHLYSFTDEDGNYNAEIESAFAEMETAVSPTLKKLNDMTKQTTITTQEKSELSYFLAMQVVRVPGFRNLLKRQTAEMAKLHMKMLASNEKAFERSLKEMKKENPDTPEIDVEELQDFIFEEKYKVEMGNENYFLKQAIRLGDHIYPAIMMKDFFILNAESVEIITSDYPVALISNPDVPPFYGGGFLMSGVLMPISSSKVLFCKNPDEPEEPPKEGENIDIGYKDIPSNRANWVNEVTINHAERFLFSAIKNNEIKEKFDNTSKPKRFRMSSPFSRKKNNKSDS